MADEQSEATLTTLATNVTNLGPKRRLTLNSSIKITTVSDVLKGLKGSMELKVREDRVIINVAFSVEEMLDLRNRVEWYAKGEVTKIFPSLYYGLRKNMTIREQLSTEPRRRPPTKLAIAETVLLR